MTADALAVVNNDRGNSFAGASAKTSGNNSQTAATAGASSGPGRSNGKLPF